MKRFEGIKPHPKMQTPFVTMPDGISAKGKGAVNRLIAKFGLKEKADA